MADDSLQVIAPFEITENPLFSGAPDESPKKRGRPKGEKTAKSTSTKKNPDVNVGVALQQVSALLAGILAVDEVMMTEPEANLMGDAINRVASYYELPDMGVVGAWLNLGIVSGMVLLPKIKAVKDKAVKNKTEEGEDNVAV